MLGVYFPDNLYCINHADDPPVISFWHASFANWEVFLVRVCVWHFKNLFDPQTTGAVVRGAHTQRDASPIIPPEFEHGFVCLLPCRVLPPHSLISFQLPPPPRARCPPLLQSEWVSSFPGKSVSANLILPFGTLGSLWSFWTGRARTLSPVPSSVLVQDLL